MLSHRLTPQERDRLRVVCSQLDGVPFVEKAEVLRASVEQMKARGYSVVPTSGPVARRPASRAA
jgi:hypothetical protein